MTSKKNSVMISARDAKYLADAMLAAASKDDVTPVLCAVYFEAGAEGLRTQATDRYRAHTAVVDTVKRSGRHSFLAPREAIVWLSKNALAFTSRRFTAFDPVVVITSQAPEAGTPGLDGGHLKIDVRQSADATATDGSISWVGTLRKGNFPPVLAKLIEPARTAELSEGPFVMRPDFLSALRALGGSDHRAPLIRPTKNADPSKPGPVYFEFKAGDRVYAEAIIQPNTNLR